MRDCGRDGGYPPPPHRSVRAELPPVQDFVRTPLWVKSVSVTTSRSSTMRKALVCLPAAGAADTITVLDANKVQHKIRLVRPAATPPAPHNGGSPPMRCVG